MYVFFNLSETCGTILRSVGLKVKVTSLPDLTMAQSQHALCSLNTELAHRDGQRALFLVTENASDTAQVFLLKLLYSVSVYSNIVHLMCHTTHSCLLGMLNSPAAVLALHVIGIAAVPRSVMVFDRVVLQNIQRTASQNS